MSFAGKVARGLLQGAAGYFGQRAEQQEFDRRADALALREQALARFNSDLRKDETTHRGTVEAGLDTVKTGNEIKKEKALLGPKTDAQIKVDQAKEEAQFRREYRMLPLETQAKLTIEEYTQARLDARQEDAQAHDRDTNPIGAVESKTGETAFVFAPGASVPVRTARGSRPKTDSGGSSGGTILGREQSGSRGSGASGSPGQDYSAYRQLLSEAAMDPRFKGKPEAQIRREIRALAARNNIPVPPGE